MIQEILMWSSVSAAFGYTFYSIVKVITETYRKKSVGCNSSCGCCSVKKDLLKNSTLKNLKLTPVKR